MTKYLAVAAAALLAIAASASDLADDLGSIGYHVDRNASATNECVSGAVDDARSAGGNLWVVVLAEEPAGGATAFSRTVLDELNATGTVLVVALESVDYSENEGFWSDTQLDQARDAATTVASDNDVVRTFVNVLTGDDAFCSTTSVAGKSAWGSVAFVLIVVGGIVYLIVRPAAKREELEGSHAET